MKNTINASKMRIFGIIALVAVIVFTMAGCKEPDNEEPDPTYTVTMFTLNDADFTSVFGGTPAYYITPASVTKATLESFYTTAKTKGSYASAYDHESDVPLEDIQQTSQSFVDSAVATYTSANRTELLNAVQSRDYVGTYFPFSGGGQAAYIVLIYKE